MTPLASILAQLLDLIGELNVRQTDPQAALTQAEFAAKQEKVLREIKALKETE